MKKNKKIIEPPEKVFYVVPFPPNSIIKDETVYKMVMGADGHNHYQQPYFWAAGAWHKSKLNYQEVVEAATLVTSIDPSC